MRTFKITGSLWGTDEDDSQNVQGRTLLDALSRYYDLMEKRWIEENAPTTSPECIHIETGKGTHTRECVERCYGVYVTEIKEIIRLYDPWSSEDQATLNECLEDTPFGVELVNTQEER